MEPDPRVKAGRREEVRENVALAKSLLRKIKVVWEQAGARVLARVQKKAKVLERDVVSSNNKTQDNN